MRNDAGYTPELCLIVAVDDEIVGYIVGKEEGLVLRPIAVKPSYQNQGVGGIWIKGSRRIWF